jgi:hypothetical protein
MKYALAVLAFVVLIVPARADSASFTFTSVPGYANSVNNLGQVAGYTQSGNTIQGYVDTGGSLAAVNSPYGPLSTAYTGLAINDSGTIAGETLIVDSSGRPEGMAGFVDSGGSFSQIIGPGGATVQLLGLNDSGQLVGFYSANGGNLGFVDTNGVFTTVADPNATGGASLPFGINASGQIVGFFDEGANTYGFLDTNGVYETIDDPLGTGTWATGINDEGEIVGYFEDASGFNGFIDIDGVFTTLDDPGAGGTFLYGINDSGELVGQTGSGGSFTAAEPVSTPEPGTLLLTALGLALAGVAFARRGTGERSSR